MLLIFKMIGNLMGQNYAEPSSLSLCQPWIILTDKVYASL